MNAFAREIAWLCDERLVSLALSTRPAWLWSLDAARILWANPTGAAIFGAASSAAITARVFDAGQPASAQIADLAARLPEQGPPQIERLRGFGAGIGRALACQCSRIVLGDRTPALLVVATARAGPELSLKERVSRLVAGCKAPVAVFSPEGMLIHAGTAAESHLYGQRSLAALTLKEVANDALRTGHSARQTAGGPVTIDRIGVDDRAVLLVTFGAAGESAKIARTTTVETPAVERGHAEPAMPERSEAPDVEPPAAPEPSPAMAAPAPPAEPVPAPIPSPTAPERRHPLRFVWQIDENDRFTLDSDEFIALAGPGTAVVLGRPWSDIAGELDLDPERRVAQALATRDTWSGLSVAWPVDGSPDRLTVELSGLPVFDRERTFRGYRGFGVCRDLARLNRLAQLRSGSSPAPAAPMPVENVVRFPASEATTGKDDALPVLSTGEHHAFYELSRRLTHHLNADRDAIDRDILQSTSLVSPAGDMRQLFDRLDAGVLIYRLDQLLYANPAFLTATGHGSLDALIEAGGLDSLLIAPRNGATEAAPGQPFALTIDRANQAPIESELIPVHWEGEAAHALLMRMRLGAAAPASAELAPAPPEPASANAEASRMQAEIADLHAILDTATDGIVVLDRTGEMISANRSAQALFGHDAGDFAGRPFFDLFAPESRDLAEAYLDSLREGGIESMLNSGREVLGRVRQGGAVPLFMTMGPIGEGAERLCAVFRDITMWKKVEDDLRAAKLQAEKASSAKSDLLAKISHEIRTPLNAIIGFSEVMMEERFGPIGNDRYRGYLKDIHTSGGHLISLINDLLDLSKIEAGKLELTFTGVSVNDLAQQCVAIMQPQANRERIIIRTSLPPALPPVTADARSVRQIMLNLLSNSIKFTGAGGQVIVSTALNDNGEVVLRVRDNGLGMSDTDIAIALEPFRQLATTTLGRAAGTGLGLPLTKALAEANHARFHIKSAPKEGTLVEVAFPAAQTLVG